jgi:uncharacterized protein
MTAVDLARLRRLSLAQQGLARSAPFGHGQRAAERALEHLGYVQIDTISVVARAHHHTLWNRVPGYRTETLDALVTGRRAFEYWFHAASFLPIRDFRFALPRMHEWRARLAALDRAQRRILSAVRDRIRSDGPLGARDFDDAKHRSAGWWNWKPAKVGLERLFLAGELMVASRNRFEKRYDLTERVLPPTIDTRAPTQAEFARYLIDTYLRAHASATLAQFTYLRRGAAIRQAVRRELDAMIAEGVVRELRLADGSRLYARADLLSRPVRIPPNQLRLLSPFDSAVIHRDRVLQLHAFDYQIECYVPARLRRFGYFCLPLLYGDRLVGRVDCKAHRRVGSLELVHLHVEHDVGAPEPFVAALADAARRFAAFNDCHDVTLTGTTPAYWRKTLTRALTA